MFNTKDNAKAPQTKKESHNPQTPAVAPPVFDVNSINDKQFSPDQIIQMQSTLGMQAVQRMLNEKATIQREDDVDDTSEVVEMQKDAAKLKGGDTLLNQVIPITPELLELVNPKARSKSNPKVKKKHKKDLEYKEVKGEAFLTGKDPDPDEIRQGALGDCYLLSAMSAIAQANPGAIKNMISGPKKDGSYDVTLYFDKGALWWKKKEAKVINVSPEFPQTKGGNLAYGSSTASGPKGASLWPMLIEKAYAKHKGAYKDIEGGFGDEAMELLTGKDAKRENTKSFGDEELLKKINKLLSDGYAVTTGTKDTSMISWFGPTKKEFDKAGAVSLHEYSVISVDVGAKTISIRNPWGKKHLPNMSVSDYKKFFGDFSYGKP